ncbi:hypothetical protein DRW48_05880 [Paracoccus suum]|uniref:Uncharacterized protein n=1 Tax=Paracoccus suum TaxID=2259340 RepID=A0A344PIS1_9RHOB|nr:hypothetical protein [Paracoccus suum]AXC49276.1 hypothetical protein DRW48_05880 [Paracoccus suum]
MSTLAISVWHERPALLAAQIENYNRCFGDPLTHMININAEFADRFWAEARKRGIDFDAYGNVLFVERPVRTYYAGLGHAIFYAVQEALRRGVPFRHVYFHTSTDLLVKPGLGAHIAAHDVGLAPSKGPEIRFRPDHRGVDLVNFAVPQTEVWAQNITLDPRFATAMQAMGATRLHKMRADGCFFSREAFFEIAYPLVANISIADMAAPPRRYPVEEYGLAQAVEFFCARNPGIRRTTQVILTMRGERNAVTIAGIDQARADPLRFGIKKFPADPDAPERQYVREILARDA